MRFLALLFLLFAAVPVGAQEVDRYTVAGVTVDQPTDSPATARDVALQKATRDAYTQLQTRLAIEGTKLPDLDDQSLNRYVQDFELAGEKISAKRYIGTFTIRFRPTIAGAASGMQAAGAIGGGAMTEVPATFAFANLNEWQAARHALQNSDGVRGVQIIGLRRNYVDIAVHFDGSDATAFSNALAAQGIAASPPAAANPRWFLRLQR